MTWVPRPLVIDRLSMTRTGTPSKALAAVWADCMVADSWLEMLMHTMASAPPSAALRKACSNAPGEGAAVSGSLSLAAIFL
jgi:hypothetical protein